MNDAPPQRGFLLVISSPSGGGKTTLARRLVEEDERLEFSVSFTTRPARPNETDGVQYRFVDDATFDRMVAEDAFLEWAEVFGHRYGTERQATERVLTAGRDLVLDIDVQGAVQVRDSGIDAVSVFVMPPDFGELARRLRKRATDSEEQMQRRLSLAGAEAMQYHLYDFLVINDRVERALADLRRIVSAERLRAHRRREMADSILRTIPGPDRT